MRVGLCCAHLLDLGGGALEQLDVARADALAVLRQRLVGGVVAREQHERVAGGAPVSLVHEQDAFLAVQHVHRRQTLLEELQLQAQQSSLHPDQADQNSFRKVLHNPEHVLHQILPQFLPLPKVIPLKHTSTTDNFLIVCLI